MLCSNSERCACAASRRREVWTAIIPPPRCPIAPPPLRMKAPNSPTLMWPEPSRSEGEPHRLQGGLGQLLGRELQLVAHEALELDVGHLARAVVVHVPEQLEPRVVPALAARRLGAHLAHADGQQRRHLAHRLRARPWHLAELALEITLLW